MRELIRNLSAERVSTELLKLLAAEDPRGVVRLMAQSGVLAVVLPEARGLERFEKLVGIETEMLFSEDALLRLAALLPDDPVKAAALAERLRLSNTQRDRLAAALNPEPRLVSWMSPKETRRLVYRLGAETLCDRVTLAWAASDRPAATNPVARPAAHRPQLDAAALPADRRRGDGRRRSPRGRWSAR
ncbi:MAG: hypothetical protein WDM85_14375 [Caulobacteraceae bacterium]